MIDESTRLEIEQFLSTGKTPRRTLWVSESVGSTFYLPSSNKSWFCGAGDAEPAGHTEAIHLHTFQFRSGERVYIGLSKINDVIVCTENFKSIFDNKRKR